jgi:hypothetical protein
MKSRTPISELPETFFEIVNPYVGRLKEFVSHVIGFAEARGDLARGQLTVDNVVDATLVDAYALKVQPVAISRWRRYSRPSFRMRSISGSVLPALSAIFATVSPWI